MSTPPLHGHCLCGAVTLDVAAHGGELHVCHCEMCRRWVGSALVCLSVKPDDLRYGGPVQNFASSDWAERGFCGTCGSSLWYHLKAGEHESYELCAGLFEDAAGLTVTKEIYIDHKPAGFAFAGDHLRQTRAEALASYGITDPEGDD